MRTFHHIGVPTDRVLEGMNHLDDAGLYITDPDQSPNRIEWLHFDEHSGLPEMLKTMPHIAYQVDDVQAEIQGAEVLLEPFQPIDGVTVAFVVEEGLPIEFLQIADAVQPATTQEQES